jgi:hypothetical protein
VRAAAALFQLVALRARCRVVAVFPYGLERLRLQDLGGAGHLGFTEADLSSDAVASPTPYSLGALATNIRYVLGGHSAALSSQNWDGMAEFILRGTVPKATRATERPDGTTVWLGRLSPLAWLLIVFVIVGFANVLLAPLDVPVPKALMLELTDPLSIAQIWGEEGGFFELVRLVGWNWASETSGWVFALLFAFYVRLLSLVATKA